ANADCMRQVASLVRASLSKAPLVVLSAMDKTTDHLFAAARAAARGDLDAGVEVLGRVAAHHRAEAAALVQGEVRTERARALGVAFSEIEPLLRGVALLRSLSAETMDAIAAFGERLSTRIFAAHLVSAGISAELVDARLVMRTDGRSGAAQPMMEAVRS